MPAHDTAPRHGARAGSDATSPVHHETLTSEPSPHGILIPDTSDFDHELSLEVDRTVIEIERSSGAEQHKHLRRLSHLIENLNLPSRLEARHAS